MPRGIKVQLDSEDIKKLYLIDLVPVCHIAQRYNRTEKAVKRCLVEAGIQIRDIPTAMKLACANKPLTKEHKDKISKGIRTHYKLYPRLEINNDEVKRLYLEEYLGAHRISIKLGCSSTTIYRCLKNLGITIRSNKDYSLEHSHCWKGGRICSQGYIEVSTPLHSKARDGYISEHLKIWEETHKKPLPKGWVIHHLNGIRNDNRPSNLVAMSWRKHALLLEPLKKRIRELEGENRQLKQSLENNQMIFYVKEAINAS